MQYLAILQTQCDSLIFLSEKNYSLSKSNISISDKRLDLYVIKFIKQLHREGKGVIS